jgi:hypothetical protein
VQSSVDFLFEIGDRGHVVEDESGADRRYGVRGFVDRGASGDLQCD